jgi:hypothetical protein
MKNRLALITAGLLVGLVASPAALGKTVSDLVTPEKRRTTVELALRLTRPPEPVALPAEIAQPFNPPGFDQPDPGEIRAAAQSPRVNSAGNLPGGAAVPGAPAQADGPKGDREILENIAAKILPTGTIIPTNGDPLLTFGRKNVKLGSHFTVTNSANGQDYELELVAVDRTTFTLRYRNEEITRPIKSGKSQ